MAELCGDEEDEMAELCGDEDLDPDDLAQTDGIKVAAAKTMS